MSEPSGTEESPGIGERLLNAAEAVGSGLLSTATHEVSDVVGVAESAGKAIGSAVDGDWDGAAKNLTDMSTSALEVVADPVLGTAETAFNVGGALAGGGSESFHDLAAAGLGAATQAAGNAIGDGLYSLVGDDEAHKSAVAFDDGDILGGLGHMASGAASTVEHALGFGDGAAAPAPAPAPAEESPAEQPPAEQPSPDMY
jgi:hypothetical protein